MSTFNPKVSTGVPLMSEYCAGGIIFSTSDVVQVESVAVELDVVLDLHGMCFLL